MMISIGSDAALAQEAAMVSVGLCHLIRFVVTHYTGILVIFAFN